MYTIGQVSEMFNIPVSTLRYYDNEGLFPNMKRQSGIRQFSDEELEALRVIDCLQKSGLEIKDIRRFMAWCAQGPSTYANRKELFEARRTALQNQIAELEKSLAMIEFKCWYYGQALAEGSEDRLHRISPDEFPSEVKARFDLAHS